MCINVLVTSYTLYFVRDDKNKDVQSVIWGQKHPRKVDKCRKRVIYINPLSQNDHCQYPVQDNEYPVKSKSP